VLRPTLSDRRELLFELISQRYERSATIITSDLPFNEWTATTFWVLTLALRSQ
jgi:DNA replication protein DnaC